ncbi:hypothetical protein CDAR_475011 [Caerostris darwini]|uniref:Uncharacterized protein n=1 Tax=Caerostris darwini TaxID=1538125 RepID=A0AAV4QQF1_9ARAC|nr:hypothetical protein CDAR_475011 [Caerostris darwini]
MLIEKIMIAVVFITCAMTVVSGQLFGSRRGQPPSLTRQDSFKPYAFNYDVLRNDGQIQNSRTESADGSGRVQGSYFLTNDEGHYREVLYLADEDGFRTIIRTNEPGTKSSNPAGVVMEYTSEIRRQFQNIAQESIAPLFNSVFGSSSQGPLVNPFSGPTGITSPSGSNYPPQRPPLINDKGSVFTAPEKAAARPPISNSYFRPDATYSQGPFPPLNQLPGVLSPKGINRQYHSTPKVSYLINGKGPVFTTPEKSVARSPIFNSDFRPHAAYSQRPFPPLNQLPGFRPHEVGSYGGMYLNGNGPAFTSGNETENYSTRKFRKM